MIANSIGGKQKAAILVVISCIAYINQMVREVHSTASVLAKDAQIRFKLAEHNTCGNLKLIISKIVDIR